MALSKLVEYKEQDENSLLEQKDDETELISKIYDEITHCVQAEGHQTLSETILWTSDNYDEQSVEIVSCSKCVKHVRIERVSEIRKGLHISMPGSNLQAYDASKKKQKWLYKHHAIVTDIVAIDNTRHTVCVQLVHMWERKDGSHGLSKTNETFNLERDELYIVSYKKPKYEPDQIVKRAEQAYMDSENARAEAENIRFTGYNVVTTNCEHFATWCVVGKSEGHKETSWWKSLGEALFSIGDSEQVMQVKSALVSLFGNGSMVKKTLFKLLFQSSDEIAAAVKSGLPVSCTVLTGAAASYFLYCLVMTIYYYMQYNQKEMCWSCCHGYVTDLWARFSVYGATSVATHFISGGSVCISAVVSSLFMIVMSVAVQHCIPDIRKAVMAPYGCNKTPIYRLDELNVADIVTLSYWCLPHDVIVTEIHADEERGKGRIRAIHYALDNLQATREVKEEYFEIKNSSPNPILQRHECNHLDLFSSEIAVLRARQRIGEQKWNGVTNRSDHVCYWAKVKPQLTDEDREEELTLPIQAPGRSPYLSTLLIGESDVHLSSDFEVGDIIKFRGTEGIVIGKDCGERKMKIELITVKKAVKQRNYFVNLNQENMFVVRYHPAHCYPKSVRADRARLVRGQKMSNQEFMDFCLLQTCSTSI